MKRIFLLQILLFGCATSNQYTSLIKSESKPIGCKLDIYMINDEVKKNYTTIGVFTVSDNGLSSSCDLNNSIKENKLAACKAGADAIKFTNIETPNGKTTCHQTTSSFLKYK